jgi:hypothetical protein
MDKVLILADSRKYIRNNCFQLQLHESIKALKTNFQIEYFYLNPKELQSFEIFKQKSKSYLFVLSTLRQRVLFNNISLITKLIGDTPLKVYDQDPWQNYIDTSPTNGCYALLQNNFHLTDLFVTSNYWANYIAGTDKIQTTFVRMGMLPKLCSLGTGQYMRGRSVEFKGSLHAHREKAFDAMRINGQTVNINLDILKYPKYLKYLQNLAIFVHDESGYWMCRGEKIPMSTGMWVKDIEVASQGCFSIRNYDKESKTYSLENIPLIKFYNNPSEVKKIVDDIFLLSEEELKNIQSASVKYIIENNYWLQTTNKIFNLQNA